MPTHDSGVTYTMRCGCVIHHERGEDRLVTPCPEHPRVHQAAVLAAVAPRD